MHYNFAPPSLRRAIGCIGFLHKINLGVCHPALRHAFPARVGEENRWHSKQFESFFQDVRGHRALYNNSIYMYIIIYKRLPQDLVNAETVKAFQGKLTQLAKSRAELDDGQEWRQSFQSCADVVSFFYA